MKKKTFSFVAHKRVRIACWALVLCLFLSSTKCCIIDSLFLRCSSCLLLALTESCKTRSGYDHNKFSSTERAHKSGRRPRRRCLRQANWISWDRAQHEKKTKREKWNVKIENHRAPREVAHKVSRERHTGASCKETSVRTSKNDRKFPRVSLLHQPIVSQFWKWMKNIWNR